MCVSNGNFSGQQEMELHKLINTNRSSIRIELRIKGDPFPSGLPVRDRPGPEEMAVVRSKKKAQPVTE